MRRLSLFALLTVSCLAMPAQDTKKWEPPATPEGWKAVISTDGHYRFVVPKDVKRTSARDGTFTVAGVREKVQIHRFEMKDEVLYEVHVTTLTGPGLRGTKVSDVLDAFVRAEKDAGFTVSEPKEVTVGGVKANEYRLSKDKVSRRLVLFALKPRVYLINVAAPDEKKLDTKEADTFASSLVQVPAEVVKAQAQEKATKADAAVQAQEKKYGVKWTMDPKEMVPPDADAVGEIRGVEFKPDAVKFEGGRLVMRQGKEFFADAEVAITLFLKPNEGLEKKEYTVTPKSTGNPHVNVSTKGMNDKLPKGETYLAKYAMKLTFGEADTDGAIPGTIYLSAPDTARSFVAGKFKVAKPK